MRNDLTYLTDSYDEKIKKINDLGAPLNILFITDQHNRMNALVSSWYAPEEAPPFELAVNAIDSIQYILDRCPGISMVVNGGDIGNDYDPDPAKVHAAHHEVMDALYRLSVPVHCCIGNHDDAIGTPAVRGLDTIAPGFPPEKMHALCMKYNPTPENYYYIDHDTDSEDGGYRIIFLNTSDQPYYLENGQYPYGGHVELSDKQAEWFENEALHTDRRILVFGHTVLRNAHVFGANSYEDLRNGPRAYAAVKRTKNVIATFAGHVHYDNIVYDEGLVTVTTLCSCVQEWAPGCPKREIGTPTETAFDVFSIKGDTLYITRFGAGYDRIAGLLRVKAMNDEKNAAT